LGEISQHPDDKALDYHPDVNIADAQQALIENALFSVPSPNLQNVY
jgi:hypothetical protein